MADKQEITEFHNERPWSRIRVPPIWQSIRPVRGNLTLISRVLWRYRYAELVRMQTGGLIVFDCILGRHSQTGAIVVYYRWDKKNLSMDLENSIISFARYFDLK